MGKPMENPQDPKGARAASLPDRLTLGDLSTCLVLGRSRGRLMGGQKSAEGDKERRTAPRPERKILDRCHDLAHRRRRSHVG